MVLLMGYKPPHCITALVWWAKSERPLLRQPEPETKPRGTDRAGRVWDVKPVDPKDLSAQPDQDTIVSIWQIVIMDNLIAQL